jgi:hypothetical protein
MSKFFGGFFINLLRVSTFSAFHFKHLVGFHPRLQALDGRDEP